VREHPFNLHHSSPKSRSLPAPAMRIRRRPQAQPLTPSPLHQQQQASDPSQPPGNQQHWLPQKEESYRPKEELHLRRPNVDLGAEPSPPARRALLLPSHPPQVSTAHTFQLLIFRCTSGVGAPRSIQLTSSRSLSGRATTWWDAATTPRVLIEVVVAHNVRQQMATPSTATGGT
jgi:hypothetical protein